MARRVVGYLEYGNTLAKLDRLVSLSDTKDLEAIDAIIGDRDEFALFRELPPEFDPDLRSENQNDGREGSEPADAKLGLAWVIALARVEFGAIIAGFTTHPEPYVFVKPDTYAYRETMQLLLEGVVEHYADLKNDEAFNDYLKRNNGFLAALTISRRIRIARSMLRPIMQPERSRYSTDQANQLEIAARDLDRGQKEVNSVITQMLSIRHSSESEETVTKYVTNQPGMVNFLKWEIEAGTAKVNIHPDDSVTPATSDR